MSASSGTAPPLWERDDIQFPRLLAEIAGTINIDRAAMKALADSMDLEPEEVCELFDRAQAEWERLKVIHCPPQTWGGSFDR